MDGNQLIAALREPGHGLDPETAALLAWVIGREAATGSAVALEDLYGWHPAYAAGYTNILFAELIYAGWLVPVDGGSFRSAPRPPVGGDLKRSEN